MNNLTEIFERLELNRDNGLYYFEDSGWQNLFSPKTNYALERLSPQAFYCFNNEPLILFFEEEKIDVQKTHRDCWNFNKSPIIITAKREDVNIYNGLSLNDKTEKLFKLLDSSKLDELNYWKITSGKFWQKNSEQFDKKNRVDVNLLENLTTARAELIKHDLKPSIANKIIGRLIFTRYLIDRKVKISFGNKDQIQNSDLLSIIKSKNKLYELFSFLSSKFKGELFPINGEREKSNLKNVHLGILYSLFNGDDLASNQRSLFNVYNFDIIPVELVSNIYENFIGPQKQDSNKAFYTPTFLVDQILKETVHKKLKTNSNCRILDPACGSGIFLVESLRLLIQKFVQSNPELSPSSQFFKKSIRRILKNNIYGIDKDRDAIEIATFSLYITLLDFFEEPKDIESFEFPELIGTNLYHGDFFDLEASFNEQLSGNEGKEFDFILGNPPWGKITGSPYIDYVDNRAALEEVEISISNKQIAEAFLIRTSDFSSQQTVSSFIVSSKILYNSFADKFREYFLNNFKVLEVLEISSVRRLIFSSSIGPASVIRFKYDQDDLSDNEVLHLTLKPNPFFKINKTLILDKTDSIRVKQSYLMRFDWLWKVLVYGNVLDYKLVKRLKSDADNYSIEDLVKDSEPDFIACRGVQVGDKSNDSHHLVGLNFINLRKKDLQRFYINHREESIWEHEKSERPRDKELFQAPFLIFKNSLTSNYDVVAAVSEQNAVFTNSSMGIKSSIGKTILYQILGVLTSDLMKYYLLMTATSVGIEREVATDSDIYSFPWKSEKLNIGDLVKSISNIVQKKHSQEKIFENYTTLSELDEQLNELNYLVNEAYQVSKHEKQLMKYAFDITIPLIQDPDKCIAYEKLSEEQLVEYAEIVLNNFDFGYKKVSAEILYNDFLVSAKFFVSNQKEIEISLNKEMGLKNLYALGIEKVTEQLFIERDIKIVNKDSVQIIKPNYQKSWQPANAYWDIVELENKILDQELNQENYV